MKEVNIKPMLEFLTEEIDAIDISIMLDEHIFDYINYLTLDHNFIGGNDRFCDTIFYLKKLRDIFRECSESN